MSKVILPPGACDAHVHLARRSEGARFNTGYEIPDAKLEALRSVQEETGLARAVVVQLAAYGDDHSVMLDALARAGDRLRGVAGAPAHATDGELAALHEAGVRANRFYLGFPFRVEGFRAPVVDPAFLFAATPRLAELGWAAEVSAPSSLIAELAPRLAGFPVPIVFEHMAGLGGDAPLDSAEARTVLDLIANHDVWVKLNLSRIANVAGHCDLQVAQDALIHAAPQRMLWGSDWPHVGMAEPPRLVRLLERFDASIGGDAALKRAILSDNPSKLFGFDEPSAGPST